MSSSKVVMMATRFRFPIMSSRLKLLLTQQLYPMANEMIKTLFVTRIDIAVVCALDVRRLVSAFDTRQCVKY